MSKVFYRGTNHLRQLIFPILLFLFIHGLPAQEILFQTSFYFEDGVGNKDTIVFGYEDVDTFRMDPAQGENPILEPWDSLFDVRLVSRGQYRDAYFWEVIDADDTLEYEGIYLDTLIAFSRHVFNGISCTLPFPNYFFFHCEHYPIKISWEIQDFKEDNCHFGSLMKAHYLEALLDARWWEDADTVTYACLANESSFVLEKTPDNYSPWDLYYQLYDDVNQDNELDTLWGMEINMIYNSHPDDWSCRYFVQNEELESARHGNTLEHGQETVYINAVEESKLLIYDYSGRLRYTQEVLTGKHEVSKNSLGLPPGLYIVQLRSETDQGGIAKKMVVY